MHNDSSSNIFNLCFSFATELTKKIIKSTNKRWLNKQVEKSILFIYGCKEINAYKQMVKV